MGKNILLQAVQMHATLSGNRKTPTHLLHYISISEAPDTHVSLTSLKQNWKPSSSHTPLTAQEKEISQHWLDLPISSVSK